MGRSDDELCRAASLGDDAAVQELLGRHRDRLKRMLAARMHPLLAKRCDPSDIIQDALADATRRLPEYLAAPKVGFFVWLRQIGLDRLVDYHRRHLRAQARSAFREQDLDLSDESVEFLAAQLASPSTSPEERIQREEAHERVRRSMQKLRELDREMLLLRFAEQLQVQEIASILQITPAATKSRLRRALEAMQVLLKEAS